MHWPVKEFWYGHGEVVLRLRAPLASSLLIIFRHSWNEDKWEVLRLTHRFTYRHSGHSNSHLHHPSLTSVVFGLRGPVGAQSFRYCPLNPETLERPVGSGVRGERLVSYHTCCQSIHGPWSTLRTPCDDSLRGAAKWRLGSCCDALLLQCCGRN